MSTYNVLGFVLSIFPANVSFHVHRNPFGWWYFFYNSDEDAEAEKECYMTKFTLSVISNIGVKPRAVPMDSDNVQL